MFYKDGILYKSGLLSEVGGILHGFSAREGGVSVEKHTASLNLSRGLGDDDGIVLRNTEIFAHAISAGLSASDVIVAPQVHGKRIRVITKDNCGEGVITPAGEACDGFVTDSAAVLPIIRTADCVPILLCGTKQGGAPVAAAVHAGWRGTVLGIASEAVLAMAELGCELHTIRAAIGAHIGCCCYEVGEDFYKSVCEIRGEDFAARYVSRPVSAIVGMGASGKTGEAKRHADLTAMNLEILENAGVAHSNIDVSSDCTMCMPDVYYSHRATSGKRGVMGAGIAIAPAG